MQQAAFASPSTANSAESAISNNPPTKTLAESKALEIMWVYYRDHKLQLRVDIKQFRALILAELVQGVPVAQVFAPYLRVAEPTAIDIRRVR